MQVDFDWPLSSERWEDHMENRNSAAPMSVEELWSELRNSPRIAAMQTMKRGAQELPLFEPPPRKKKRRLER